MSQAEFRHVSRPQRFEVIRQADLASPLKMKQPLGEDAVQIKNTNKRREKNPPNLYILAVLPSSSGIATSGAVAGYVTGI